MQEPLTAHLFRAAKTAGAAGAYFFQTSPASQKILPDRPAVYVAEASNREQAREIHRKLWNLGAAPFIIVLLPGEVRVYTGFNFSKENGDKGLIAEVSETLDLALSEAQEHLTNFRADEIDSGRIWQTQSQHLTPDKRVDMQLLDSLRQLETYLLDEQIPLPVIHSLIGKFVYIRYLRDRDILSDNWLQQHDLKIEDILSRESNLDSLLTLTKVLEARFNGSIFPFPADFEASLSDETVAVVASAFKGDDLETGQLHLEFDAYDFSYIPVEMLSSIYEQFLKSQGTQKKVGAVYTPEPVADYLICELNDSNPLMAGMKILDPCCGSGIFLVLAYRRLIEIALSQNDGKKLKPTELRKILCDSIYGVERNRDACYVAEFSLLLTLLDYLNPPELHRNKQFKFPSLHNSRIFECDFFNDESAFWQQDLKFDWVVGNPPWIELKSKGIGEEFAKSWIERNTRDRPIGGRKICEAFSWRVGELLTEKGHVGLLIHANSLFNHESRKYRAAFFDHQTVKRVTNFSHLAYILFGGRGEEPAATMVYGKPEPQLEKTDILHYAPFVINQLSSQKGKKKKKKQPTWMIAINENEISTISQREAASGEMSVWKTALWGNRRDQKSIKRLQRLFPRQLGSLIEEKGWHCHKGLEVRQAGSSSGLESAPYLSGWRMVEERGSIESNRSHFRFSVPESLLAQIPDDSLYIRKGRSLSFAIAKAPHIFMRNSPGHFAYSDADFVIRKPQMGISTDKKEDAAYLQAVSVFLSSSFAQYFLFFQSPSWGVGRSQIYLADLKRIPLPDFSEKQILKLAGLQKNLSQLEACTDTPNDVLQNQLDDTIEMLFEVPEDVGLIVREFMSVRLQLIKGKTKTPAVGMPTSERLQSYGIKLQRELNTFTRGSGVRHKVTVTHSPQMTICSVEFVQSDSTSDVIVEAAQDGHSEFMASIADKAKQQFSQWVYVQRSIRIFDYSKVHICKPSRLIDWTKTQALNDSDDIIAEILAMRSEAREVS